MDPQFDKLPLKDIHFDPDNPRLPQRLRKADEVEVLKYLLLQGNLIELMLSIGTQGFFLGEPLLVAPRPQGGWMAVEGNRRLGALKLLASDQAPPIMPAQVAEARTDAKFKPQDIPVLKFGARDDILTYLGYRHITGIKEWDPLAKARYLAQLRKRLTTDHAAAHTMLAKEIGSKASYVAKLLTGLLLVERARDTGILSRLKMLEDDLAFSLLTTAIGYENTSAFLGLRSATDVEAPNLQEAPLEELFGWLFGKPYGAPTAVGDSRNLDKLARVLGSEPALRAFRRGTPLEDADLLTGHPLQTLRSLMLEIEMRLSSAQSTISLAEGIAVTDVEHADRIRKLSAALHSSLNGVLNPAP